MSHVINAVVVDCSNEVIENIKSYFKKSNKVNVIATFNDGNDALKFIIDNNSIIDIIVTDLILAGLDGLGLIEELRERKINKKVIVLSKYYDEALIEQTLKYNISNFLIKPFSIISLERRIIDSYNTGSYLTRTENNIDNEISHLLHNIGIPSHIRGYKYIREGVAILYNNPSCALITKDVYPTIAEKYETTPSRVERAIRHAIEVGFIRGDLNLMDDLFGFSISVDKSKPTNSEFLNTLTERIKLDRCVKL